MRQRAPRDRSSKVAVHALEGQGSRVEPRTADVSVSPVTGPLLERTAAQTKKNRCSRGPLLLHRAVMVRARVLSFTADGERRRVVPMFRESIRHFVESTEGAEAGLLMDLEGIAVEAYSKEGSACDIEVVGA